KYIKEMLKKFELEESKPTKTPMSTEIKLTKDDEADSLDNTKYQGTGIETIVYADSDHAGDYVYRKSTSGICTFMGCCLTSWFFKKQTTLAISTTKAEYVSAEMACQQALWMKQALIDYDIQLDDVPIMCDNKGVIDLSKNPVQHSRIKHIEIRHHFLRDNVQKGNIFIEKVASKDNLAVKRGGKGRIRAQSCWESVRMGKGVYPLDSGKLSCEIKEKNVAFALGGKHVNSAICTISGLKINVKKTHLLGVGIPNDLIVAAASTLGCSIMKTPFKYLGVTVGSNMSNISALDDIISKLNSCLSKWKVKTLSIGGRLTLLKSVVGSTPIYWMSLYKVPKSVLNSMEAIRRNFFNGAQDNDKKITWVKCAKYISHDNSLWYRVISAIHGLNIQKLSSFTSSIWNNILKEVNILK
nr:retrotransposon protein [Tanacetum cinerariifolium]